MKPRLFRPFFALVLISLLPFLTGSCKKSSGTAASSMTASIKGSNFTGTAVTAYYSNAAAILSLSASQVGSNKDTVTLALDIPYPIKLGQTIPFPAGASLTYADITNRTLYTANAFTGKGSILISTWDTVGQHVSGSFGGMLGSIGGDSLSVTFGTFNVIYQLTP